MGELALFMSSRSVSLRSILDSMSIIRSYRNRKEVRKGHETEAFTTKNNMEAWQWSYWMGVCFRYTPILRIIAGGLLIS